MKRIRTFFRKLAKKAVSAYAERLYNSAVQIADERHGRERIMIYVASKTFSPSELTTYDRYEFKAEKAAYGHLARRLTLQTLRSGCYYHTPDTAGNQRMSESEVERRKKAFIRERLKKAKLL